MKKMVEYPFNYTTE